LGYQSFSGYYITRIAALLGNLNECSYWFSRAKLDSNIPPLEILSKNTDLNSVVYNIVSNIINESVYYNNERIRFHNDCLKIEKQMSAITSNLSESAVMRTALSRSTFNILIESNSPLHDFIAFWKPVTQTFLAKKRLQDRLKLYGMEQRKEVPGDGNCQMHSLSDQLCGSFEYSRFIRRSVVSWLRANGDLKLENGALLKEFVFDKSWDQYCNEMAKDGIWGDHLTLIAACELFNIKVIIISSVPGDNYIIEINPELSQARRVVMLSHYAEYHYGSVQHIDPNCRNMLL